MSPQTTRRRGNVNSRFPIIVGIFVTALIVSNIVAVKLIDIGGFVLPAAVVVFPISYIIGDVLTEVYGYAKARQAIWLGFACNLFAVGAIWIAGVLPAAGFWGNQSAFDVILGYTPRLLLASFAGYLIGEFANSAVLSKMKVLTNGRLLWSRTIGSTIVGEGLDSTVFITIAFIGTVPLAVIPVMVLSQWVFKVVYEVLATPLTYVVVNYLKRTEGIDTFDRQANLNPFMA